MITWTICSIGSEVHERVNIENYDNYTIQFQQERYWYYIEEMSNGSLQDNITTFNVPLLVSTKGLSSKICN